LKLEVATPIVTIQMGGERARFNWPPSLGPSISIYSNALHSLSFNKTIQPSDMTRNGGKKTIRLPSVDRYRSSQCPLLCTFYGNILSRPEFIWLSEKISSISFCIGLLLIHSLSTIGIDFFPFVLSM
jgi:hypothetical protein